MAKFKNCKHLCTIHDYKKEFFKWCSLIDDCPHEDIERDCEHYSPMTNADRIRSMTDEELALAIMCPAEYDLNFNKNEKCNGEMNKNCYECSLKWLQEKREEKDVE